MSTWEVDASRGLPVIETDPDSNFVGSVSANALIIIIGGTKTYWERSFTEFDMGAFPGAVGDITAAKLVLDLKAVQNEGELVNFDRIKAHPDSGGSPPYPADWVENEATWNDWKDSNAWTAAGGDLDVADRVQIAVPGSISVLDVLGFKDMVVEGFNNRNGILSICHRLDDESTGGSTREFRFHSYLATLGAKPKLVITYGAVTHPPDYRRRRMTV